MEFYHSIVFIANMKDILLEFFFFFFQVKQNHAKSVFLACTAAIKNDVHIALYILPYVLTQVLQDGSQHDNKEVIYFC